MADPILIGGDWKPGGGDVVTRVALASQRDRRDARFPNRLERAAVARRLLMWWLKSCNILIGKGRWDVRFLLSLKKGLFVQPLMLINLGLERMGKL